MIVTPICIRWQSSIMIGKKAVNIHIDWANAVKAILNHNRGLDKQNFQCKIVNIFLPINFNICFGCSKEPSH